MVSPFPSRSECLLVSKVERDLLLFLFPHFFFLIVLEIARISSRTLAFRGSLSTIYMFAVFARFYSIAFRISSWVSFPSSCPFKRPGFVAGIEIMVPCLLLCIPANDFFQSGTTGRFSFLKCILQMQGHERFQFLGVMELVLVRFFTLSLHLELLSWREVFRATWCRSLARCHPSTRFLKQFVEVKKSFGSSTDLESSHRSSKRFVFLSRVDCPVVPFPLPSRLAS